MVQLSTRPVSAAPEAARTETEVLFREARRRERRRRLLTAAIVIAVVAAGAGAGAVAAGHHPAARTREAKKTPALPTTPVVSCSQSGTPLHLVVDNELPAAGSHYWAVMITSASQQPCSLRGFPAVTLLGPGTAPLVTTDVDSTTFESELGVHTIEVDTSAPVSFLFITSGGGAYTPRPACPLVTGLTVRFARSSAFTLAFPATPVPIHDVSGSAPGDCDVVAVSPFFEGTPEAGMSR
jgi:hypothetical protein